VNCDDGDPCTTDTCTAASTCSNVPIEGCVLGDCNGEGAIRPRAAAYRSAEGETFHRLEGWPNPRNGRETTDGCRYDVVLQSEGFFRMLGAGETWECTGPSPCNPDAQAPLCSPTHRNIAYWVWGESVPLPGLGGPIPPHPFFDSHRIQVEGYCVQTNEVGLKGAFEGFLAFSDTALGGLPLNLEFPLEAPFGLAHLNGTTANDWEAVDDTALTNIEATVQGELRFTFSLVAPSGATEAFRADLRSWRSGLYGTVVSDADPSLTGTIAVQRVNDPETTPNFGIPWPTR